MNHPNYGLPQMKLIYFMSVLYVYIEFDEKRIRRFKMSIKTYKICIILNNLIRRLDVRVHNVYIDM